MKDQLTPLRLLGWNLRAMSEHSFSHTACRKSPDISLQDHWMFQRESLLESRCFALFAAIELISPVGPRNSETASVAPQGPDSSCIFELSERIARSFRYQRTAASGRLRALLFDENRKLLACYVWTRLHFSWSIARPKSTQDSCLSYFHVIVWQTTM